MRFVAMNVEQEHFRGPAENDAARNDCGGDLSIALKLFITIFLFSLFFFEPNLSHPRFVHLTKAIVETGKTSIEDIQSKYQIIAPDSFETQKGRFIDPTPGLSFISLVSYVPYDRYLKSRLAQRMKHDHALEFQLSQFFMSISTTVFFSALLVSTFFLSLRHQGCPIKKSIFYALFLYFGTPIVFYSKQVDIGQNLLETTLLFLAFFTLSRPGTLTRMLSWMSGFFSGLAVFVNASAGPYLFLYPLMILFFKRKSRLLFWVIGCFFGVLPLFIYDTVSFGHPFIISHSASGISFLFDVRGALSVAFILLFTPDVGLVFYVPFLVLLFLLAAQLWKKPVNRIILPVSFFFILGIGIQYWSVEIGEGGSSGGIWHGWYLNQGGGGPRYLLTIIPFFIYLIANETLTAVQKNFIASPLIFLSLLINVPGLFWTGGKPFFLNNLVLFLKNGFHSYLIDLIKASLDAAGFNSNQLSLWPALTIMGLFIWWVWVGSSKTLQMLSLSGFGQSVKSLKK